MVPAAECDNRDPLSGPARTVGKPVVSRELHRCVAPGRRDPGPRDCCQRMAERRGVQTDNRLHDVLQLVGKVYRTLVRREGVMPVLELLQLHAERRFKAPHRPPQLHVMLRDRARHDLEPVLPREPLHRREVLGRRCVFLRKRPPAGGLRPREREQRVALVQRPGEGLGRLPWAQHDRDRPNVRRGGTSTRHRAGRLSRGALTDRHARSGHVSDSRSHGRKGYVTDRIRGGQGTGFATAFHPPRQ